MTDRAKENNKIIDDLVTKHFSLDDESLSIFKDILHNPEKRLEYIDPIFHPYLDEDFRYKVKIDNENKKFIDKGWAEFNRFFKSFLKEYEVSYENFHNNKIVIDGKEYKLFKYIKKWYINQNVDKIIDDFRNSITESKYLFKSISKEEIETFITRKIEIISSYKLPLCDIELVLSFNFADWFLSSTSEEWSSCLDLDSNYENCYWAGLPGLIIDKNRLMVYLTNNDKKTYNNIIVDKLLARTWGLLDSHDRVFLVRQYPNDFITPEAIESIFNIDNTHFYDNNGIYNFKVSKHKYDKLLFNKINSSLYIYQDNTAFGLIDDNLYLVKHEKGYYGFERRDSSLNKFKYYKRLYTTNYKYEDGLYGLIVNDEEIIDTLNDSYYAQCVNCGDYLYNEDDVEYVDEYGDVYCRSCFEHNFTTCNNCNQIFKI